MPLWIVILVDGVIDAVGSHEELLASDPIYQEIYESQMKSQNRPEHQEEGGVVCG